MMSRRGILEGDKVPLRDAQGRRFWRGKVWLADGTKQRVRIPEDKRYSPTSARDYVDWAQEQEALSNDLLLKKRSRSNVFGWVVGNPPEPRMAVVYLLLDVTGTKIKIGWSENLRERLKDFHHHGFRGCMLLGFREGTKRDEKRLHMKYGAYWIGHGDDRPNVSSEWFWVRGDLAELCFALLLRGRPHLYRGER